MRLSWLEALSCLIAGTVMIPVSWISLSLIPSIPLFIISALLGDYVCLVPGVTFWLLVYITTIEPRSTAKLMHTTSYLVAISLLLFYAAFWVEGCTNRGLAIMLSYASINTATAIALTSKTGDASCILNTKVRILLNLLFSCWLWFFAFPWVFEPI